MSVVAVILAAGKGTRMRSTLPKPLVPLAGRALVLRLIFIKRREPAPVDNHAASA